MPSPEPPPYPCTDDRRRERTHRRRRRARRAVSASRRVRFDSARLTTARGGFFRQWDLQKSESHLTRSKARRKARRPSAVHTPSPASWLRLDVDVDVDRRAREADRPSVARRASRPRAPRRRVHPRARIFRAAMEHGQDPVRRRKSRPQGGREATVRVNPDVHLRLFPRRPRSSERSDTRPFRLERHPETSLWPRSESVERAR